ncbi:NEDD4-binding protein 3-B isoform X1 [Silurus meridionalis]|uniref:NEDD4-binding protein 3-B isoform X1 n=1 Tax=Silurus meridionalis TaxID=175797 RepID=UPI001EEACA13|nr:NEDD4-binding protein 3-B isoform X1 [Silurus meridionalis]XP_046715493.1 NEDD4-binding protein 3-B isoform X1 [Silurus meridionalis]KAI5100836.1 NEDD4-binding protein 3 [Silurus meridionalis]
MATVQALPFTQDPSKNISAIYPATSLASAECVMGSVGSLIEKHDHTSPTKGNKAVPQVPQRQSNWQNRKNLSQGELLNYLNITKKESKSSKHIVCGNSSIKREHSREEENLYAKVYHKDGKEVDLGKNSLPIGGKFDKPRFRSSAFKPVTPKGFSSMQNLYPSNSEELMNGKHSTPFYSKSTSKSLSTSSSSSSPSRVGTCANKGVLAVPHEEETASDSGHNSMSSLPPYRPPFRPQLGHISASMGHIEHIGFLERTSGGIGALSTAPEAYELSHSLEDVVKDLEERLQEKEHELWQMRKNLDESEDAIAQVNTLNTHHVKEVFEGKQRLWEKEVSELKQLYTAKLRQVSQQSQRSQRALQLQLYKAQHERSRVQDELNTMHRKYQSLQKQGGAEQSHELQPQLEETQWEVCQKAGEISLLKQQLKDSQAEVTQKLSEIFLLKTQLRETRNELSTKEGQLDMLQQALQASRRKCSLGKSMQNLSSYQTPGEDSGTSSATEDRLRAELLLERRQNEAQALAFDNERSTWQLEKEKVLRYQRELQASYLEMFHKNESLERELQQLREGRVGAVGGGAIAEPSGLPWIERIESSEI